MTRYQRFPAGERKCRREACTVVKTFRRGVGYCTRSCASKDGIMRVSPGKARERALKAGKAAGESHRRRALERLGDLSLLEAYQKGYGNGYNKGHAAGYYKGRRDARREKAA